MTEAAKMNTSPNGSLPSSTPPKTTTPTAANNSANVLRTERVRSAATVIGPMLVTLEELQQYEMPCKEGHVGKSWNLNMKCMVNGVQVSQGNLGEMDWTFAEIIERCSYGVNLFAGDVIGSGTVGTGCFLELNGTGKLKDPNYQEQWLQPGDLVEMEIDGLGKLSNTIVKEESDFSILKLKKNI